MTCSGANTTESFFNVVVKLKWDLRCSIKPMQRSQCVPCKSSAASPVCRAANTPTTCQRPVGFPRHWGRVFPLLNIYFLLSQHLIEAKWMAFKWDGIKVDGHLPASEMTTTKGKGECVKGDECWWKMAERIVQQERMLRLKSCRIRHKKHLVTFPGGEHVRLQHASPSRLW